MHKPPIANRDDITALALAVNTAAVAIIATLIETREPNLPFGECVIRAISRVQSVDDPNVRVK